MNSRLDGVPPQNLPPQVRIKRCLRSPSPRGRGAGGEVSRKLARHHPCRCLNMLQLPHDHQHGNVIVERITTYPQRIGGSTLVGHHRQAWLRRVRHASTRVARNTSRGPASDDNATLFVCASPAQGVQGVHRVCRADGARGSGANEINRAGRSGNV